MKCIICYYIHMYKNDKDFLHHRYDPMKNRTIDYKRADLSRVLAILSAVKRVNASVKLLDIGCYDGQIAYLFKQKIGDKCVAYGVETNKAAINLARKKGVKVIYGDVTKGLKFPKNMFDYVVAGEIIEHIVDTDFFMREIKRVLKPNGLLILTTPNSLSLGRRLNYILGNGVFLEVSYSIPNNAAGHVRYFTFGSMREFVAMHKFEIVRIFSDTVTFPMCKSDLLAQLIPTFGHHIIAFLRNHKLNSMNTVIHKSH